jgi:hypothetical protein
MVRMMTFEFPTAASAIDFFSRVDGPARVTHRVVDVETDKPEAARELAASCGGKEA